MTAESIPRIVRLLPTRFSRDPKAINPGEKTAAGLLLACTLLAILWANSPWAESYWALLDIHVGASFGDHHFQLTVKHLVNDGLMTFFFFIVGLEVTREFAIGELTDRAAPRCRWSPRSRAWRYPPSSSWLSIIPVRTRTCGVW